MIGEVSSLCIEICRKSFDGVMNYNKRGKDTFDHTFIKRLKIAFKCIHPELKDFYGSSFIVRHQIEVRKEIKFHAVKRGFLRNLILICLLAFFPSRCDLCKGQSNFIRENNNKYLRSCH